LLSVCELKVGCNKVIQDFNDVHHTSSVKLTDEKPILIVEVVCVFAQHEVSSDVETSANDVHFPVFEFAYHMKPVCIVKKLDLKLDLTRFEQQFLFVNFQC